MSCPKPGRVLGVRFLLRKRAALVSSEKIARKLRDTLRTHRELLLLRFNTYGNRSACCVLKEMALR